MKLLLDTWSIKNKLGAAFGVVLLVLLAVSLTVLVSLREKWLLR